MVNSGKLRIVIGLSLPLVMFGWLALSPNASSLSGSILCPIRFDAVDDDASRPCLETETLKPGDVAKQFRAEAQQRVEELKANAQQQSQEFRQKACEARKVSLERRMDRMQAQTQKHKEVFDKIFTRVQQFYTDKQLSVSNYNELVANVTGAQTIAQANIEGLTELNGEIDCTKESVANGVQAFKDSLKETRDSLKDYRKTIVELIKAVHQSVTESNDVSGQQ
ncbi:hypothetical protein A2884_02210 [Candidatus Saccharibacteria bacterium RIFCSPHIGHO2_01_FULL_48_12]|nr:MAG: hypothetical protein A2884_02210 [Candidatus Saccharibacteria bacterium RIFCSPHIGHO2_01_FULL_48_12]OGL36612.1 MAG: hypothetical protein A3F38_00645 [Candidatus Saccharibacteria bacterium RIFCSPHIGHO2_12_FULL_48_21]